MDPLPGDRIVVRYRLGQGGPADWRALPNPGLEHTPSLSDLTGFLIEQTHDALVVERDGRPERIPVAAITSLRRLSTRTVRNSEIRALERALTESTPAAERAEIGGWIVSASSAESIRPAHSAPGAENMLPAHSAPGAENMLPAHSAPGAGKMRPRPRANAAVPLEFGASTSALAAISAWYLERGLPTRLIVPERLLRAADVPTAAASARRANGHPVEYEVLVGPEGDPVEVFGDDRGDRLRLRSLGYRLHHTFTVVDLDPGGST